jgi:hypothetical protein
MQGAARALEGIPASVKGRRRHRRMARDGGLNAHKRQPGDIPVVEKLLAAGAVLHAQAKRHRSSVSFRWTCSPAFGRHPESLESADHLGELAASYPRAARSAERLILQLKIAMVGSALDVIISANASFGLCASPRFYGDRGGSLAGSLTRNRAAHLPVAPKGASEDRCGGWHPDHRRFGADARSRAGYARGINARSFSGVGSRVCFDRSRAG